MCLLGIVQLFRLEIRLDITNLISYSHLFSPGTYFLLKQLLKTWLCKDVPSLKEMQHDLTLSANFLKLAVCALPTDVFPSETCMSWKCTCKCVVVPCGVLAQSLGITENDYNVVLCKTCYLCISELYWVKDYNLRNRYCLYSGNI